MYLKSKLGGIGPARPAVGSVCLLFEAAACLGLDYLLLGSEEEENQRDDRERGQPVAVKRRRWPLPTDR